MYREKITELYKWKNQKTKIPILIKGAKKVGKTWLACTFAKEKYKNIIYILFDQNIITYKKNEENEETIINIEQLKEKISKEKDGSDFGKHANTAIRKNVKRKNF